MKPNQIPKPLELRFATPVVAQDGNAIAIREDGKVELLFFQIRNQTEDKAEADVVAAIRLDNVDQLKEFQKSIGESITKHETKEK
jgi:hypothetical protein